MNWRPIKLDRLTLSILAVVILVIVAGVLIFHFKDSNKDTAKPSAIAKRASTQTHSNVSSQLANTYEAPSSSNGSTIKVQYPNDWKLNAQPSNAYTSSLVFKDSSQIAIHIRTIYLNDSFSAKDEWNNCPSFDACGPSPGDKKLSESEVQINGMDVYFVKMQGTLSAYNASVIKNSKLSPEGTLFTEFILNSDEIDAVKAYQKIINSVQQS